MNYFLKYQYIFAIVLLFNSVQPLLAQVGIGTTTPEGALDLETTTTGLVFPKVPLVKTNQAAPVKNPRTGGSDLAIGTVVYNTSRTQTGSNDVFPGIYVWNGTTWIPQFIMEEYKRFEQTPGCQRIPFYIRRDINGLGLGSSFTPKYSGYYRLRVTTSFGAGEIKDLGTSTGNKVSTGTAEGNFFFTFKAPTGPPIINGAAMGDNGAVYCHAYSTRNENNSPTTLYNIVNYDASRVYFVKLTSGINYSFRLENHISETDATDYTGDGEAGSAGENHIGHDIPCSVEFTFLGTDI